MSEKKRYLITSALPYANGPLHIGHLAGAYINADIYARFLRLKGKDVAFICGSDEHGAAITMRSKKEGVEPQAIVDRYHSMIKKAFEDFGISFDIYHRTSSELHHKTSQEFFTQLNNNGKFQIKETEQYYDNEVGQFLADRYITGTCPKCAYDSAYGDQCENCGSSLSPKELIEPKSTLSESMPVLRKTTHWYLPLDEYEKWLSDWIVNGRGRDWKKNVFGQCKSWIEGGLHARAMTRDLDWGVKVPLPEADGKVLYVWLDAPIGYISATKQWASDNGKDWRDYWQSEDSELIHFIGKDNIVFHCIIFPVLLNAHGGYNLPTNIPANEFMNLEGRKISTSRNWAIWLHEYLEDFPGKEDELRYVLTANMPETKDSEFTWKDYQDRVNNELVANLGNFVNRVFVLSHKYFGGNLTLKSSDESLQEKAQQLVDNVDESIHAFRFREGLASAMNVSRLGNEYLATTEPWKLMKTNEQEVEQILANAVLLIVKLISASKPFLPKTASKLEEAIQIEVVDGQHTYSLKKLGLLFEKIEDDAMDAQRQKLHGTGQDANPTKYKDMIEFADFSKIDLRLGTIKEAAKVENTDKLLHFKVEMGGGEIRDIISGVALHYSAEETIGQQVCVVANLSPRKMRGIESQGMILFAEDEEGRLRFITPTEAMPNGSSVS